MQAKKTKPTTVLEYIKTAPKESQAKLREMRAIARVAAPKATESVKWGMAAYSSKRILVMFGGFQHHIGLYPTPSATTAFAKELSKFKSGRGSVQFPLDQPLPKGLISKIIKFRLKESIEEDKKWRTERPAK